MDLLDGGGHHCNDLRGFYYAVGNHAVPITMLESDTTDVALLASGDVRNLLRAVEECATRDNTKELNVLMNDISVSVTARNIALLALIHRCYRQSVEAGKNTDEALRVASGAFFSVQFELLLCKQHSQWLDDTLRELIEATSLSHVLPFVSLVDDAVLPKLKTVWSAWLHRRINDWEIPRTYSRRFLQVRQRGLQAQMIGAGSMIDGNISAAQMTDLRRRRQECFKNRVEMSMFTHRHLFYTRDSPVEIEFFFRHGVLKRKGQSAMRMRAICDIGVMRTGDVGQTADAGQCQHVRRAAADADATRGRAAFLAALWHAANALAVTRCSQGGRHRSRGPVAPGDSAAPVRGLCATRDTRAAAAPSARGL
ncbi:MAG: hypothetical protein MHM6MM_008283 [Cercozoa sp. M6MM]